MSESLRSKYSSHLILHFVQNPRRIVLGDLKTMLDVPQHGLILDHLGKNYQVLAHDVWVVLQLLVHHLHSSSILFEEKLCDGFAMGREQHFLPMLHLMEDLLSEK